MIEERKELEQMRDTRTVDQKNEIPCYHIWTTILITKIVPDYPEPLSFKRKKCSVCDVEKIYTLNKYKPLQAVKSNGKRKSLPTGPCGLCELCCRELPLSKHHLIPKSKLEYKVKVRNRYTRVMQEEWERVNNIPKAPLCSECHIFVHEHIDNDLLAKQYNTIDKLRTHPDVTEYLIKRLPDV